MADEWITPIDPAKVRVLAQNSGAVALTDTIYPLDWQGGRLYLLGVNDTQYLMPPVANFTELVKEIPPGSYILLLHHTPDLIKSAASAGVDFYLTGHTHGGQIRLPFWGALVTSSIYYKEFEMGFYQVGPTSLYVNRGVGTEGREAPRVRFLAPPEIAVFDLMGKRNSELQLFNPAASPISTSTPTSTPIPSFTTPTPSSTVQFLSPTATRIPPISSLPQAHTITLKGHAQQLSIDCEASAAVDWAAYYGIIINELEFQSKIPLSDNPDEGFVGNVNNPWGQIPPFAYGVHAEPVAKLLSIYGIQAIAVKNASLDWVKDQISHNNPLMVWVVGRLEKSRSIVYTDKSGRKVTVAPYEHVVILTGYNETTHRVRYISEGKEYEAPYQNFLDSWSLLGNMAIVKK